MTTASLLLATILAAVPAPSGGASDAPNAAPRGPAILDFHAEWCGPCRQMRPQIEALVRARYPVRSIDVDERPELAEQFKLTGVPTFVIVDAEGREIGRRVGFTEAKELAALYRESSMTATPVTAAGRPEVRGVSTDSTGRPNRNPEPWATVVRIRVQDRGMLGFGSGTLISSNAEESIILTCAHIFSVKGPQPRPNEFRLPVLVELFDGRLGGPGGQTVRPLGRPIVGEVIDYDFGRDVALVRIRPGRAVPTARVVPDHWSAEARMRMYTVGCSHGEDATAWNTIITSPSFTGLNEKPGYEAIQCLHSPKQGRSGGGLFTEDGYVAGVCNFAFDPRVARGLYASPRSIYTILDRNGLSDLYNYDGPRSRGAPLAIAANESDPRNGRSGEVLVRAQSPEGELASASGGRVLDVPPITVPDPEILGVRLPEGPTQSRAEPVTEHRDHTGGTRSGWIPVTPGGRPAEPRADRTVQRPASQPSTAPRNSMPPTRRYSPAGVESTAGTKGAGVSWTPIRIGGGS